MTDTANEPGWFGKAVNKTKHVLWTGGTKRKWATGAAGAATVGAAGYYAYSKRKARKLHESING